MRVLKKAVLRSLRHSELRGVPRHRAKSVRVPSSVAPGSKKSTDRNRNWHEQRRGENAEGDDRTNNDGIGWKNSRRRNDDLLNKWGLNEIESKRVRRRREKRSNEGRRKVVVRGGQRWLADYVVP